MLSEAKHLFHFTLEPCGDPSSPRQSGTSQDDHYHSRGFSLIEMLVSIAIIVLLMSAVFPFLMQAQKRFQGNVVESEASQSVRAALEVMAQEIGQAGYNPQFTANKYSKTSISANGCTQFINPTSDSTGNTPDITGIHPGDWVSVDTGQNQELVEVTSTSSAITSPASNCYVLGSGCTGACTPPGGTWIGAKFEYDHTTTPYIISSYKMPYGGGLLYGGAGLSNDAQLEFYGDINQDGNINYVVYSLSPMVPATTVTINGAAYTLYNLYRSITPVQFPTLPQPPVSGGITYAPSCPGVSCDNPASPMVEKVLYDTTNQRGPTTLPIFGYPNSVVVGVTPNQVTVIGTIVITLSIAVNPEAMETGNVQWYTMATQIRPLNLNAAVNVNNSQGSLYLPMNPKSLPMSVPSNYYP